MYPFWVFGMDFSLALSTEKSFHVVFVEVLIMMDICSGSVLILPLFVFVRVLSFRDLLLRDRSSWPRCLLWHGWLPALACAGGASPWADSVDDIACAGLERLLGSCSEGVCREWVPPDQFVDSVTSSDVSDHPDVWTDGSFVFDELSGVGVGVVFVLLGLVLDGLVVVVSFRVIASWRSWC